MMRKAICRDRKGRNASELMVLGIIIGILLMIVVPIVRRAIIYSNEIIAVKTLKSLSTALEMYKNDRSEYPESPLDLINKRPPYFMNVKVIQDIEQGKKAVGGYLFEYNKVQSLQYHYIAAPLKADVTGRKHFIVDETADIKEYIPPDEYHSG